MSEGEGKVYCQRCGEVFGSRKKYDRHPCMHEGPAESCPLDTISGILGRLFRKG